MTCEALAERTREVALRFLAAYWAGDLKRVLAECTSGATIELPPSVPMPSPAPIATVLQLIFTRVYPRFLGGCFDVRIERCLASEHEVVVEYRASGRLTNGRNFDCRYVAVIEIERDAVRLFRPYTDTQYVAAELLSSEITC